jgi:hypothetical protein
MVQFMLIDKVAHLSMLIPGELYAGLSSRINPMSVYQY